MESLQELELSIIEENKDCEGSVHTARLILQQAGVAQPEQPVQLRTPETRRLATLGGKVIRGIHTMRQYSTLAPVPA